MRHPPLFTTLIFVLGLNFSGTASGQSLRAFMALDECTTWICAVDIAKGAAGERFDRGFPWRLPLRQGGARVSCGYGARTHPVTGQPNFHAGVDLAAAVGDTVRAAGAGLVRVATDRYLGIYIEIDHLNGFVSRYGHLDEHLRREGSTVTQGEPIGLVGATGRTTGPHVHWSVHYRGEAVDPLRFRESVLESL